MCNYLNSVILVLFILTKMAYKFVNKNNILFDILVWKRLKYYKKTVENCSSVKTIEIWFQFIYVDFVFSILIWVRLF